MVGEARPPELGPVACPPPRLVDEREALRAHHDAVTPRREVRAGLRVGVGGGVRVGVRVGLRVRARGGVEGEGESGQEVRMRMRVEGGG